MLASLLQYYQLSLSDGQRADPPIEGEEVRNIARENIRVGRINKDLALEIIEAARRESPDKKLEIASVVVAPIVLSVRLSHTEATRNTKSQRAVPLWISASVNKDGYLTPIAGIRPWMSRACLKPIASGDFVVGNIDDLDHFLEEHDPPEADKWKGAIEDAEAIWKAVVGQELFNSTFENYAILENGLLTLHSHQATPVKALLELYNDFKNVDQTKLTETSIGPFLRKEEKKRKIESPYDHPHPSLAKGHVGNFELAYSQREALASVQSMESGEIVAVNGPPGTGKTTLIQSILATGIVDGALQGDNPYIALATSSNNQAITNLIDSLSGALSHHEDDNLTKRWISGAESIGLYCHSQKASKRINGEQYLIAEKDYKDKGWLGFPKKVETGEFVAQAEESINKGAKAFFERQVENPVDEVHELLKSAHSVFLRYVELPPILRSKYDVCKKNGFDEFDTWVQSALDQVAAAREKWDTANRLLGEETGRIEEKRTAARKLRSAIEQRLEKQGLFEILFSFLPSVYRRRVRRPADFLEENGHRAEADRLYQDQSMTPVDVTQLGNKFVEDADNATPSYEFVDRHVAAQRTYKDAERFKRTAETTKADWLDAWSSIEAQLKEFASLTKDRGAPEWSQQKLTETYKASFEKLHDLADVHMRKRLFHLALRYWECRWLAETKEELQKTEKERKNEGQERMEARLRRFAMLTPCFVATCFKAAGLFKYIVPPYKSPTGDWATLPMLGFFDHLIVDEAGQVLPEVGAPVFALADKAIVVGDTKQIEPVVQLQKDVDLGNIRKCNLLDEINYLEGKGYKSTSGNIMEMAQTVTSYSTDENTGMFLAEHRRCFDEIIGFCSAFYQGRLVPMRGKAPKHSLFPPMGYAHIRGRAERKSGSWANQYEAQAIVDWLCRNKKRIEHHYPDSPFHEIVAIVTPFKKHARCVIEKLEKKRISAKPGKNDSVTVGTVHSLQGAERPIVLFSTVYDSKCGAHRYFFDCGPSMLNVAVSRAKDSFLVFGDMSILKKGAERPSQRLASILFEKQENEICDVLTVPELLEGASDTIRLVDVDEHQQELQNALMGAKEKILIVSPFLSAKAVRAHNLCNQFQKAVARGVAIQVVTCRENVATSANSQEAITLLKKTGIEFVQLEKIHNKTLAVDCTRIVEGSFNWLSASRSNGNQERSLAYRGPRVGHYVQCAWDEIGDQRNAQKT